jgi:hypothetical protein
MCNYLRKDVRQIILIIIIGLSTLTSFGQASWFDFFSIHVKFDKSIPVSELELSYFERSNNYFDSIHFKIDTIANELEINGCNIYVVGAPFPLIIFSLDEATTRKENSEIIHVSNMFYLVTSSIESYVQFDKELLFDKESVALVVSGKNIDGKWIHQV